MSVAFAKNYCKHAWIFKTLLLLVGVYAYIKLSCKCRHAITKMFGVFIFPCKGIKTEIPEPAQIVLQHNDKQKFLQMVSTSVERLLF